MRTRSWTMVVFMAALLAVGWGDAPRAASPPGQLLGVKALIPFTVFWAATATVNGKLYVIAGSYNDPDGTQQQTDKVQIYDPATDTWTEGAPKPTPIYLPAAAVVDGKIYVMGGRTPGDGGGPTNKNEMYDPATNTWTTRKNIPVAIRGHALTAVGTKIYMWGGNTSAYQKTSKIYDTMADSWSTGPTMPDFFAYGNAIYNPAKNQVYIVGGVKSITPFAGNFNPGAWIFDVATNAFLANKPAMPVPVREHGIAVSSDGSRLYVFGGSYWDSSIPGENPFYMNQVLDCDTQVWQPIDASELPPFPSPPDRGGYPMAGAIGGKMYVVGGQPTGETVTLVEEYDPASWSFWEPNPKSPVIRQAPAVQAVNGIIYSIGGWYNGGPVSDVTTFDPATGVWGSKTALDPLARINAVSAAWNGKIVISGGNDGTYTPVINGYTNLYNPDADTFTPFPPDPVIRTDAFGAVVGNTLYVFGGTNATGETILDSASALDLTTGTWSTKANLPMALMSAAAAANGTKIYIIGGLNSNLKPDPGINNNILIYDTVTNTYSNGSANPYGTYYGVGTAWDKYIIQDGGYHRYYSITADTVYAETSQHLLLYDTTTDTWLEKPRGWGRAYHGGAVVGDKYYSLLGADWNFLVDRLDIFLLSGTVCTLNCSATANPASGQVPLTVNFTASATPSDCTGTPTFSWAFGDGATSTSQNPTHMYSAPGIFQWTMVAQVDGTTCTQGGVVTVTTPCAFTCSAAASPAGGNIPLTVAFAASVTPSGCTGSPTYAWAFGDGQGSTDQNPSHTYTSGGTFTWTLTATLDGKTCSKTGTISVSAYDIVLFDDASRSKLCLNSATGNFLWTVLRGAGAGTYTGQASVSRYGGVIYLKNPSGVPWKISGKIYEQYHKATATFDFPAGRVRSTLIDSNTANDPPGC